MKKSKSLPKNWEKESFKFFTVERTVLTLITLNKKIYVDLLTYLLKVLEKLKSFQSFKRFYRLYKFFNNLN